MLSPGAAPGAASYLLEARGVRKSYGANEVLKGVDLLVASGEMVFLIGPSGSGKSTLLRCCNRLEEPSGGAIRIGGVDLLAPKTDINKMRRQIGMVFQSFNLYPHLTALGNVALALRKAVGKPRAEAEAIALENLSRVGLADKAGAYPSELSGGQQQRVAIARALALEPKIILMDEPTSALDPELVGEVLKVVRDLRQTGITLVIASHEMRFAREAADRVLFLDHGRVIEEGDPETLFGSPKEERTQRFLRDVQR
jgi:polar amino acid transport system ATP-binding protein